MRTVWHARPIHEFPPGTAAGLGEMDGWASQSIRAVRRDGTRVFVGTDSGLQARDGQDPMPTAPCGWAPTRAACAACPTPTDACG